MSVGLLVGMFIRISDHDREVIPNIISVSVYFSAQTDELGTSDLWLFLCATLRLPLAIGGLLS
jgi:hypothetical protein